MTSPERAKESSRRYRERNILKARESVRRYRAKNLEKVRSMNRNYQKRLRAESPEKIWAKRNPERQKQLARRSALLREYGITPAQYEHALSLQGGVCAICGHAPKTRRLAVDHDHGASKRSRGLVCHICNKYRIGMNTPESARRVLAYLESDFDIRNLNPWARS